MATIDDYKTPIDPTWCPGCGNQTIWLALRQTLSEMRLEPYQVNFAFDIGCSSNMADKINGYAFKSLHGRVIPVAVGISVANPDLPVLAIGGDGGIFEEGINHLIWAARSNYNITVLMHNNQVFGLTTGQATTTTRKGEPNKTAPWGVVEEQLNPVHIALVSQASFVARGFAGDLAQLKGLIKQAIEHKGFAFLEVLQPCVTYNKLNTYEWFRERIYKVDDEKEYDASNWEKAFTTATTSDKQIPTGVIYQDKTALPYLERIPHRKGKRSRLVDEVKGYPIEKVLEEFE